MKSWTFTSLSQALCGTVFWAWCIQKLLCRFKTKQQQQQQQKKHISIGICQLHFNSAHNWERQFKFLLIRERPIVLFFNSLWQYLTILAYNWDDNKWEVTVYHLRNSRNGEKYSVIKNKILIPIQKICSPLLD